MAIRYTKVWYSGALFTNSAFGISQRNLWTDHRICLLWLRNQMSSDAFPWDTISIMKSGAPLQCLPFSLLLPQTIIRLGWTYCRLFHWINCAYNASIWIVFYMAFRYTSIKYSGLFFGGFYGKYVNVKPRALDN